MEITIGNLWKNKKLLKEIGGIIYLKEADEHENNNPYVVCDLSANFVNEYGERKRSIVDFSISKYYDMNNERYIKPNRKVYI
tara:strand:- start:48 stop:293 length:246 start_codon:yes stop_codon:yes gene_type:complete